MLKKLLKIFLSVFILTSCLCLYSQDFHSFNRNDAGTKYLPWQERDKFEHFYTGVYGGLIVASIYKELHIAKTDNQACLYTVLTGIGVGLAYEKYKQNSHKGRPNYADMGNTALGYSVAGLISYRIRF